MSQEFTKFIPGLRKIQRDTAGEIVETVDDENAPENKSLLEYFGNIHLNKSANQILAADEVARGATRGTVKGVSNIIDTPLSVLNEATGGSIDFLNDYLDEEPIARKIESLFPYDGNATTGKIVEGVARVGTAYGTGFGLASKVTTSKIGKVILTELFASAFYPSAGEPNLANLIGSLFNLDEEDATNYVASAIDWASTTEDDNTFWTKLKTSFGDSSVVLLGGKVLESMIYIPRIMRTLKQNPKLVEDLAENLSIPLAAGAAITIASPNEAVAEEIIPEEDTLTQPTIESPVKKPEELNQELDIELPTGKPGREIYESLTESSDLTNIAIVGVLANLNTESGFDPKKIQSANKIGDNLGKGRGIAQWEVGGRFDKDRVNLVDFAEDRGTNWDDLQTQIAFIAHEMSVIPEFKKVKEDMNKAKTAEEAMTIFLTRYEKAGKENVEKRIADSQFFNNLYGNKENK